MWEIEPEYNKIYSCQQSLIISYANYFRKDYQMMFSESWGFNYNSSEDLIGRKIYPGYKGLRFDILKAFHGISVIEESIYSQHDLIYLINEVIERSPLVIEIDAYICWWSKSYQTYHSNHNIMILKYNKELNELICIDPYWQKGNITISLEILKGWKGVTFYFENLDIKKPYLELRSIAKEILISYLYPESFINNIILFKNDLLELSDFSDEIKGVSKFYESSLLINLKLISNQRMCFSYFLEYMSKAYDYNFSKEVPILFNIGELYEILKNIIAKEMVTNIINYSKNHEIINKIIELESNSCQNIYKILIE